MRIFCSDQGRTRVFGYRKQSGTERQPSRMPQPETRGECGSGQKGPFMDGNQLNFVKMPCFNVQVSN